MAGFRLGLRAGDFDKIHVRSGAFNTLLILGTEISNIMNGFAGGKILVPASNRGRSFIYF
jgi:hypothetical protein